jgi:hypothetical protein
MLLAKLGAVQSRKPEDILTPVYQNAKMDRVGERAADFCEKTISVVEKHLGRLQQSAAIK